MLQLAFNKIILVFLINIQLVDSNFRINLFSADIPDIRDKSLANFQKFLTTIRNSHTLLYLLGDQAFLKPFN